jgi:hypothetical protein
MLAAFSQVVTEHGTLRYADGRVYTGALDEQGRPHGFGIRQVRIFLCLTNMGVFNENPPSLREHSNGELS